LVRPGRAAMRPCPILKRAHANSQPTKIEISRSGSVSDGLLVVTNEDELLGCFGLAVEKG
jgi:hypothetical protein